jgi:hypothetical protein
MILVLLCISSLNSRVEAICRIGVTYQVRIRWGLFSCVDGVEDEDSAVIFEASIDIGVAIDAVFHTPGGCDLLYHDLVVIWLLCCQNVVPSSSWSL